MRDGRVVKGRSFASLVDSGDPVELAQEYQRQGADEIVVLDIAATPKERSTSVQIIKSMRRVLEIPLTLGGGLRTKDDAETFLRAGADKVAVNTAATLDPCLINRLAAKLGTQSVVVAIDAEWVGDDWRVKVRGGHQMTARSVTDWASEVTKRGAGEILLTSFNQDGQQQGYDLALIEAVSACTTRPVIASGGAGRSDHLIDAIEAGASAVLVASILHEAQLTIGDLKTDLIKAGMRIRS